MMGRGRMLVMLNGEGLDIELWRGNLYTLDTLRHAHIPSDGHWASRFHRRTMLLKQVTEFCQEVRGRLGLLVWLGRELGSKQLLQVRQALCGGYQIKGFESCLLIDPEPSIMGWNLINFCCLVVGGKLLHVIRKKPLDFVACTMMDYIYKAWFAEFNEHFELVTRFELHIFCNRHWLRDLPFLHKCHKCPNKADVVFV